MNDILFEGVCVIELMGLGRDAGRVFTSSDGDVGYGGGSREEDVA